MKTEKIKNECLGVYADEYYDLSDDRRSKMDPKYDHIKLTRI